MILRKYKQPRINPNRNPAYLAWVRNLPCVVCRIWKLTRFEYGKIEAAHVGARGLGRKCSDIETIPLCAHHHRTGPQSHHSLGRRFWTFWRINRIETIREYQEQYEKKEKAA